MILHSNRQIIQWLFLEVILVTMLVVFPFSSHVLSETVTKESIGQAGPSLSELLSKGWTISHYSVGQFWIDAAADSPRTPPIPKPLRYMHNFIVQKDKSFRLCWGDTREGFKVPCLPLNDEKVQSSNPK